MANDTATPLTEEQLALYEALAQRTDDDWPGYRELAGWDMTRADDRAQLILRSIPALVAEVRRRRQGVSADQASPDERRAVYEELGRQLTADGMVRIGREAQERALAARTQRMVDAGVWTATPEEMVDMASRRAYRATCDEFGGCVSCGADTNQVRAGCPMCAVRAELREAVRP